MRAGNRLTGRGLADAGGRRLLGLLLVSNAVLVGCHAVRHRPPPALGRYECHSGLPLDNFTLLDRSHYAAYDPYRGETSTGEYAWTGDTIELRSGRGEGVRFRWAAMHAPDIYVLLTGSGNPTHITCSLTR